MRRLIAIILAGVLALSGCAQQPIGKTTSTSASTIERTVKVPGTETSKSNIDELDSPTFPNAENSTATLTQENIPEFNDLGDPRLLQYIQDSVYAGLVDQFSSEDYIIENVSAIYYSNEYLEELAYNSKANIFFGFTLEELNEQFQGTRYVFTLSDEGETKVQPFEDYDNTYDDLIKNVAIGTGVILVCVTVSVVSGGVGAPAVSTIFAASAKTGTAFALSSGVFSGVAAGAITGIQTKDFDQGVKTALLTGSESFKWGAITGALVGGLSQANALRNASSATKSANAATTAPKKILSFGEAETNAKKFYERVSKVSSQVSYLGGEEVSQFTPGSTRPDLVRYVKGVLEAIEVKYINFENSESLRSFYRELKRQVTERVENLPAGSTQRICLNVQGRDFPEKLISEVIEHIQTILKDVYPNIPIEIMR